MRTTVRIDDDLLRELRKRAVARKEPLATLLNEALRDGLAVKPAKRGTYKQRVFSLGAAKVNLDKALAFAEALEDEEIIRKMAMRK